MQLKRNKYQDIENELLKTKTEVQNFSKALDFPFPENYKNIVTRIKTIEICADCILYDSVESVNETNEFESDDYWCFAGTRQGDRWVNNSFLNDEYKERYLEIINSKYNQIDL